MSDELRERLAAIEHERWAHWQRWMHDRIREHGPSSMGDYMLLSGELFRHWERQIATPYANLSEREKQSDRGEVDRYWPLIASVIAERDAALARVVELERALRQARDHIADLHISFQARTVEGNTLVRCGAISRIDALLAEHREQG